MLCLSLYFLIVLHKKRMTDKPQASKPSDDKEKDEKKKDEKEEKKELKEDEEVSTDVFFFFYGCFSCFFICMLVAQYCVPLCTW